MCPVPPGGVGEGLVLGSLPGERETERYTSCDSSRVSHFCFLDFTTTHTCFGRSNLHPIGQLTHTRRSDDTPEPEGVFTVVVRTKIIHYRQVYLNRADPIV